MPIGYYSIMVHLVTPFFFAYTPFTKYLTYQVLDKLKPCVLFNTI